MQPLAATALAGFMLSLGLIVAIGAQNAFVLKQGLQRRHVLAVCLMCACSDALLILTGVFGFGRLIAQWPALLQFARYAGMLFLFAYGCKSLFSAWYGGSALQASGQDSPGLLQTLALCLAFTWLNPHVYLDTVVLLGSVSTQYATQPLHQTAFATGAMAASFFFFFALGLGARYLSPLFQRPTSWRVLDGLIAMVMFTLAWQLSRL